MKKPKPFADLLAYSASPSPQSPSPYSTIEDKKEEVKQNDKSTPQQKKEEDKDEKDERDEKGEQKTEGSPFLKEKEVKFEEEGEEEQEEEV